MRQSGRTVPGARWIRVAVERVKRGGKDRGKKTKSKTEPVIIRSAWFVKQGRVVKSWKRRWFVLRGDGTLRYFTGEDCAVEKGSIHPEPSTSLLCVERSFPTPKTVRDVLRLTVPEAGERKHRVLRFYPEDASTLDSWRDSLSAWAKPEPEEQHASPAQPPPPAPPSIRAPPPEHDRSKPLPVPPPTGTSPPPLPSLISFSHKGSSGSSASTSPASPTAVAVAAGSPKRESSIMDMPGLSTVPTSIREWAGDGTPLNVLLFRVGKETAAKLLDAKRECHTLVAIDRLEDVTAVLASKRWCFWRVVTSAPGAGEGELDRLSRVVESAEAVHQGTVLVRLVAPEAASKVLDAPWGPSTLCSREVYEDDTRMLALRTSVERYDLPPPSVIPRSGEFVFGDFAMMTFPSVVKALLCPNTSSDLVAGEPSPVNDTCQAVWGAMSYGRWRALPFHDILGVAKSLMPGDFVYDRLRIAREQKMRYGTCETLKFWLALCFQDCWLFRELNKCIISRDFVGLSCFRNFASGISTLFQVATKTGRLLPEFAGKCYRAASMRPDDVRREFVQDAHVCVTAFQIATKSREVADRWLRESPSSAAAAAAVAAGPKNVLIQIYTVPPPYENTLRVCADVSEFSKHPDDQEVLFLPLVHFVVMNVVWPKQGATPSPETPIVISLMEDFDKTLLAQRCWRTLQSRLNTNRGIRDVAIGIVNSSLVGTLTIDRAEQPDGTLQPCPLMTAMVGFNQTELERRQSSTFFGSNQAGTEQEAFGHLQPHSQRIQRAIVQKRTTEGRGPPIAPMMATAEFACFLDGESLPPSTPLPSVVVVHGTPPKSK